MILSKPIGKYRNLVVGGCENPIYGTVDFYACHTVILEMAPKTGEVLQVLVSFLDTDLVWININPEDIVELNGVKSEYPELNPELLRLMKKG